MSASAPGKLMLYGEHAVVYGYPCIVTAVDRRIEVTASATDDSKLTIATQTLDSPFVSPLNAILPSDALPKDVRFVATAVRKLLECSGKKLPGLAIETKRQFHHEYGLGSSSAVTVATVKAVAELLGLGLSDGDIFAISFATVREAQKGIGSGFDVAAATFGGTLRYVPGESAPRQIDCELPLFVVYSGIKASTTALVGKVAELKRSNQALAESFFRQSAEIVDKACHALDSAEFELAGSLMTANQHILQMLAVSSDSLDIMIAAAKLRGAWGAKLSGAGGGDCIIGLASDAKLAQIEAAMQICQTQFVPGLEWLALATGVPGVRIEMEA